MEGELTQRGGEPIPSTQRSMRWRDYPRVLHVIPKLTIGGTERQLVEFILRSHSPEDHFVATFDEPGQLAEALPHPPIPIGGIDRSVGSLRNIRTALRFHRITRTCRPDLVHAHLGISEVLATFVPRRIPVVASRRGRNVGFETRRILKVVEGIGHRRTDLLLCNSDYLAKYAEEHDLWAPPTCVIHNGVDLERFQPTPMPPKDPATIAVVANLKSYKGQGRFLRAFDGVVAQVPEAVAVLVGDGPAREGLVALASELGIAQNVVFTGQVEDTRPYVARAHIVALTSTHEGFPNALLEAMAMGRPVVATRVGGVPELVREGIDGLLTSLDPNEISRATLKLVTDEGLRSRMGAAARGRAERFDWDRVVRETEAAYRQVLEGRSGRSARADRNRDP